MIRACGRLAKRRLCGRHESLRGAEGERATARNREASPAWGASSEQHTLCKVKETRQNMEVGGFIMVKTTIAIGMATWALAAGISFPHPIPSRIQVIGAASAPPVGPGPGTLSDWSWGDKSARTVSFAPANHPASNSFYVAYDGASQEIYVPTAGGTTILLNRRTLKPVASFPSLVGGRVARVTPNHEMVLELSASGLVAYSTGLRHQRLFSQSVGGNAVTISPNGQDAFIGGNMDSTVTEVSLPSGRIVRTYPVRQSGDLVWADGQVFSANIQTGVLTAIHPNTGTITPIATPEVDPTFSYKDISQATAGFMQIAISPHQGYVYAAGFSGHILRFSAQRDTYLGEVAVHANPQGPDRLSGLAVLPGGKTALVTVENLKETALVKLGSGKILQLLPGVTSNRWITVR